MGHHFHGRTANDYGCFHYNFDDVPFGVPGAKPGHGFIDRVRSWPLLFAKACLTLAILSLVGWWSWFGFKMFSAEQHMAIVRAAIKQYPVLAFVENVAAYNEFPFQIEIRRQLPGAFMGMISAGVAEADEQAAEVIWQISQTVGTNDPGILLSRGVYLLNFDRTPEIIDIADKLIRIAPHTVEAWVMSGYAGLLTGNAERVRQAIETARKMDRTDEPAVQRLIAESEELK
jgi:hypothetical protein